MYRLDLVLWFANLAMEIVLIGLFLRRRTYRTLPVFSIYLAWAVASDIGVMFAWEILHNSSQWIFNFELGIDSALQLGVLIELAWSVLRPIRSSLPRWSILAIVIMVVAAAALLWPVSGLIHTHVLSQQFHQMQRLYNTISILRILYFLVLAAGSQLLSLSWHDRELQVATGLGFYSLVSLGSQLLHAQISDISHYHLLDQLMPASYLVSLVYWAVCILQKEAARQEFSPQMRSFLLTVSGAARANRIAMQQNALGGDRTP